jgi:hypothetical protein
MLLKLKLDTKQVDPNLKKDNPQHEGIVIDMDGGNEENNFVVDGPEAQAEQRNALTEIAVAKEAEVFS